MVRLIATQFGDNQIIAFETCWLYMQPNSAPHGMKIKNYFLIALVLIIDNK